MISATITQLGFAQPFFQIQIQQQRLRISTSLLNDRRSNRSRFVLLVCCCARPGVENKPTSSSSSSSPSESALEMAIEPIGKMAATDASASLILTSGASGRVSALLSLRALRSLMMLATAFLMLLTAPFRGRRRTGSLSGGEKVVKDDQGVSGRRKMVRVSAKRLPWRNAAAVAVAVDHEVATRRAVAVRRVILDKNLEAGKIIRDYSFFSTARGDTLLTQSWFPLSVPVRGLVVILHGLNEHSGRYGDFAKKLNANGYKVFAMDWIGHGGSDGLHAYVHSLDYAVMDLKKFIEKMTDENSGVPCFCFGHSTGGAIILKTLLDPEVEARVSGVVLTSPAVGVQPSHPIYAILAPVLSFLLPKYEISGAAQSTAQVSRDPEALKAKYSDPLVYTGAIRVRTGYEILRITTYLQNNLWRVKVPFMVLHGSDDGVTDPKASKKLFINASSDDKTLKLCEGLFHDLLFEPEKEYIMEDIINWINCRVEQ